MYLPTQHGGKLARADLAPLGLEAEQEDKVLRLLYDLVDQEYSAQSGRQRCAKCGEWYDSRPDNDECLACSPV